MLAWRRSSAESGDRLIDFNWTPPFLSPRLLPKKNSRMRLPAMPTRYHITERRPSSAARNTSSKGNGGGGSMRTIENLPLLLGALFIAVNFSGSKSALRMRCRPRSAATLSASPDDKARARPLPPPRGPPSHGSAAEKSDYHILSINISLQRPTPSSFGLERVEHHGDLRPGVPRNKNIADDQNCVANSNIAARGEGRQMLATTTRACNVNQRRRLASEHRED